MWQYLFALLCLLLAGCASHAAVKPVVVPPTPLSVAVWHEFDVTMHVDTAFSGVARTIMREAAHKWRTISSGHVRINLEFDLDFTSTLSVLEHANDSMLIGALSTYPIVAAFDRELGANGKQTVLAATTLFPDRVRVVLIIDRIGPENFETVVIHEFGHVFGLPDLAEFGAVMSGKEISGVPLPTEFTKADVDLCRKHLFCL